MPPAPPEIVRWVAAHIVPQEPAVRGWLRRQGVAATDAEDLVQEAYCRIAGLSSVAHVERPEAYLFQTVRNLHLERLRRSQLVMMTALTEALASSISDERPGPERETAARLALERVEALVARLPARCRQIFLLKRVEGLSQREIAARLGVTEHVVENDVMKGLRLILGWLAEDGEVGDDERPARQRA